jgi:hypothetical protein
MAKLSRQRLEKLEQRITPKDRARVVRYDATKAPTARDERLAYFRAIGPTDAPKIYVLPLNGRDQGR